ncbi:tRNA (adenosine(37)-N6)-threonylcarbamoyltransferase complex ATPase subunit type 1 TsaE [Gephyromycinifex aptenodytis]|uniref:tRNA (adenosine(37)-N6)-threonylcarbamoyltransferase complex ATPase subunit type 1 TsaE n=1 Tax=Gephyromycinifex aptenodytis TaxID=2716227 RepID=UPI0014451525
MVTWRRLVSAEDTADLGRVIAARLRPGDVLVLAGELGAGKTTFTQGLGEGLGVRGPITSPTFVISRIHPSEVGGPALVHVDAYRLSDAAELDDLDLDADVNSSVTVIEWGAGMAEQLAESHLRVELVRALGEQASAVVHDPDAAIDLDGPDPRQVRVLGYGPRWADEPILV